MAAQMRKATQSGDADAEKSSDIKAPGANANNNCQKGDNASGSSGSSVDASRVTADSWLGKALALSSSGWFPLLVACASFINNFTLVLSGPITLLFMAAVLSKPERRYLVAIMNAVGVTCGAAVLIYLVQSKGEEWIKTSWPSVFEGDAWERASSLVRDYGAFGAVLFSCAPIVLHPLIVVGVLADMSPQSLLVCILVGRIIKYIVMATLAVAAPTMLRFFGVSSEKLEQIKAFKRD